MGPQAPFDRETRGNRCPRLKWHGESTDTNGQAPSFGERKHGDRVSVQVRLKPRGTLTVVRARQGAPRVLGPGELLTLDEATEVLGRPREHVVRAIRAGFLRVRRKGSPSCVTVQACRTFLAEERADLEAAHASRGGRLIPAEDVFRQIGD